MRLDPDQATALGELMIDVARDAASPELREHVGGGLLRLLHADQFASYVWHPTDRRFTGGVVLNMSTDNAGDYERHYQFHDPITRRLQRYRRATFVEEVLPREALHRSEFFCDFLARDGLHHGLNFFAWAAGRNIGDLRVWRSAGRPDFTEEERRLLEIVGRSFTAALRRVSSTSTPLGSPPLTRREQEVAHAVARGLTDAQIAALLHISFGTVRTHLGHVFEKLGAATRTQVAHVLLSHGG